MARHKIIDRIDYLLEDAKQRYSALDTEVEKSIRYYMSHQWDQYGSGLKPFTPPPLEGEMRFTGNKVAGFIDKKISKLTAGRLKWSVSPATSDRDDQRAAKVSERCCEWAFLINDMEVQQIDLLWWALLSPRSYLYTTWDPKAGRSQQVPVQDVDMVTGESLGPLLDENGQPEMELLYEGEPRIEVCSFLEVVVDPVPKRERDARWAIRTEVALCDEAERRFGTRPEPESVDTGSRYWRRYQVDRRRQDPRSGSRAEEELCLLKTFWHVPSVEFPGGARFVVAGDVVLEEGPHPYEDKKIPFIGISERTIGGSQLGDWVMRRTFDCQDESNVRRSQMVEHCDKVSNPIFTTEESADVQIESMEGGVGYQATYSGTAPGWLNPPSLSADVWRDMERVDRDLKEIGEVDILSRDISRDTSGKALIERIEEDESVLGTTRTNLSHCYRQAGKQILSRCHQFMTAPRLVRLVGNEGMIPVTKFVQEDIRPDLDVHVDLESASKFSKSVKNSTIMQVLQIPGFLEGNPAIIPGLVSALEIGALDKVFRQGSTAEARQIRQIERIVEGFRPEEPVPYEDLGVSLAVMTDFMNTVEFESLPPPAVDAMFQTWQMKSQLKQQQDLQAMQMQIAMSTLQAQTKGMATAGGGGDGDGPLTDEGEVQ